MFREDQSCPYCHDTFYDQEYRTNHIMYCKEDYETKRFAMIENAVDNAWELRKE